MSGFCAVIRKDSGSSVQPAEMEAMIRPLEFPGQGRREILCAGQVGLAAYDQFGKGAKRFVWEDDSAAVVCDAEIYNFKALGWEGDVCREAELIGRLYLKHGASWWKPVHGVFGALIWDKRQRKAFAFTDRIGVKQVVYHLGKDQAVVASRIKCVAATPSFRREVDGQAVLSYMEMEAIPTPHSIYKGIRKIESGFMLTLSEGKASEERVWKMTYPADKVTDLGEIGKRSYSLLKDAVAMQLEYGNSLEEAASFLSGGTDSSSIAGLVDELRPGQSRTFSIGFDESGYDEMQYARIAAKAFKTKHTEYYVTADDILNALPSIVRSYDEPFGNSSAIPTYFCAKAAAEQGVKMLLGGDGGDEIFGGNSRYYETFANFRRYPKPLVDLLIAPAVSLLPRWAKPSLVRKVENYVIRSRAPLHEKIHGYSLRYYMPDSEIFEPGLLGGTPYVRPQDFSERYIRDSGADNDLDRYMYNDLKQTLMDNDLRKVGPMTELAGVNVRYPFLDCGLVEFTGRIPADMKVHGDKLRYAFKEGFKGLLPREIIEKKKHGFGLPIVRWMLRKGKLNDFLKDVIFDPRASQRGFFRKDLAESLYRKSQDDKTPFFGTFLYYFLFLELWMRENVDR